jgi:osmotically inducible protein OsmC
MDRKAEATWNGGLKDGNGSFKVGSGALKDAYSFASRFEGNAQTNPEEMIGAAHAACYSMALSLALEKAGHTATSVTTKATVRLNKGDAGFKITGIDLVTRGVAPGVSEAEFKKLAEATRTGCIVSQALSAVPMTIDARLEQA